MNIRTVSIHRFALFHAAFLAGAMSVCAGAGAGDRSASTDGSLLSRNIPSYASSGSGDHASDANYGRPWRSSGTPASLSYDLSSVPAPRRQRLLVVWYNDYTYSYDHAVFKWPGYNNPGAYTIEINSAPGGSGPPPAGWVVVDTVDHNTRHSREHLINFAGYNWLRLQFTASDGSPKNTDIAAKVDIYDGTVAPQRAWLFIGDSITANGMSHAEIAGFPSDSFGNQVAMIAGDVPVQENAGMPGWLSGDAKAFVPLWLEAFPGRFVTLNFGTNDAAGVAPQLFYDNMSELARQTVAQGKVPVIPLIPWASRQDLLKGVPALNVEIKRLLTSQPCAIAGPDLYDFFKSHPQLISGDGVHPNDAGYAELRKIWAQFAAQLTEPRTPCLQHPNR